jgi:hypothetical protein
LGDVDGQNMVVEPVHPQIEWNNLLSEPTLGLQNALPEIDWNSLQITGQDEEDRMEIVSEERCMSCWV